ncbi:MAG TPA: ATP-binding protein [Thermodesulfovibrionales bacterium]|nr:ATP-binding protein [Thermodesulfovibrionales bacterium]
MKRVLFRRILLSYLIVASILLISLEFYLSRVIKNNYISTLRGNLLIQSRLITEQIPLSLTSNLDNFCRKYKEKTGSRITIIDSTGRVVGDSDELSEKMGNHLDRPEIKEASVNNIGSAIRFSKTIQKDFFYLAVTLDNADRGFLRLSVPLHDLGAATSDMRRRVAVVSLIALLSAILIGLFQTGKITKSIEEIAKFSREIKSGNFKARLFLKEKGEISELAKNINDMAQELKTMLEHSQEERHKMEEILRNMSDGLMLMDTKGKIVLCNSAVKIFFGIELDMEGKPLIETLRSAELINILSETIRNKEIMVKEIEITYPKQLYLIATAIPFYYPPENKNISGIILSLHDITRLKQLEDIRKDFVANVSHEIKTPITAIKGFAETLLEGAIDDRENALKFLQTIKNHGERLNSLVDDLLTLSSIELGDIRIEKRSVNINTVTDTVFTILSDKARAKGLYLKKSFPAEPVEIYADKDRLVQILLNLVDNSIKFTEHGGVRIGLDREGELNIIFVEDTGIGISKRHLSRLGERFYRVDRSRSRELGGTGLGLAIVKHLVKAHGWEMKIESTPNKGTKIQIHCI